MHGPMNVKLIYSSFYLLETNTHRPDDSDKGLQKGGGRGGWRGRGERVDWIRLPQGRDRWCAFVNTASNLQGPQKTLFLF